MHISSDRARSALTTGDRILLDLGAGRSPRGGYLSVDIREDASPDILADLNAGLPDIPDDSVDAIYSSHTLEHLNQPLELFAEMHRILKPGAVAEIVVPHWSNPYYYSDLTHIRPFGLHSFSYVSPVALQPSSRKVPLYLEHVQFSIDKLVIEFYGYTTFDRVWRKTGERWINKNFSRQDFYERRLASTVHAWQLRASLSAIKARID